MSPVENPTAPSRMALSTVFFICSISSVLGSRLALPITSLRTSLCPIKEATLIESFNESIQRRYFPMSVFDEPQLPVMHVVTPSKIKFIAFGSFNSSPSRWVCTSIKPGATIKPAASIVFGATKFNPLPRPMIFPSFTATSP